VQEGADVTGPAPARVLVVVRDEAAKFRGIARLGRGFGLVDERADLVLGLAGGAAAREAGEQRERGEATQAAPPTAESDR
jgi:hypothetical protein